MIWAWNYLFFSFVIGEWWFWNLRRKIEYTKIIETKVIEIRRQVQINCQINPQVVSDKLPKALGVSKERWVNTHKELRGECKSEAFLKEWRKQCINNLKGLLAKRCYDNNIGG